MRLGCFVFFFSGSVAWASSRGEAPSELLPLIGFGDKGFLAHCTGDSTPDLVKALLKEYPGSLIPAADSPASLTASDRWRNVSHCVTDDVAKMEDLHLGDCVVMMVISVFPGSILAYLQTQAELLANLMNFPEEFGSDRSKSRTAVWLRGTDGKWWDRDRSELFFGKSSL